MLEKLPLAFDIQGRVCRGMGSPLYADLLQHCSEELTRAEASSPLVRLLDDWRGDLARDFVPLRVLGGVHALVLAGQAPGLACHYPSVGGAPAFPAAWREFLAVLDTFPSRLRDALTRVPQTNEVARSCGLIGGFLRVAERFTHPLRLCELGASAGLNQYFDKHRYRLGEFAWGPDDAALTLRCDWRGGAPPLAAPLAVSIRSGCDRAPIDLTSDQDRIRLMSYFWADQIDRIERLRRAIDVALDDPVKLARANAADWLGAALAGELPEGLTTVVFHSSFWTYLSDADKAAISRHIERAAAAASEAAPLAWLRVEDDGPQVAIDLTYWPGGVEERLGTASAHGAWVEWGGAPVAE
jgi:hypothetical protein